MISRFLVPLFLCLFTVPGFAAEPPFDRARLLGTWEFQLSGSLSSFTGYTTYRPDGTCVQIGRGKTLGMTKWIYVETHWRLEGDQVVASVTRSSIAYRSGSRPPLGLSDLPPPSSPIGRPATARTVRSTELFKCRLTFSASWQSYSREPQASDTPTA